MTMPSTPVPAGMSVSGLALPLERQILHQEVARHAARRRHSRAFIYTGRILLVVLLLSIWEFGSGRFLDPFFVSAPSKIWEGILRLFTHERALLHIRYTLTETVIGYGTGAAAGLASAVLLTLHEDVYQILEPLLLAVYGIPRIALAPLIIMWFGIGLLPKIIIAAIMVFFVVLINTVAGIRTIDPWLIRISRTLGGRRTQILRKVVFPAIAPYVITSLRVTVPMAVIGAVVGEFISSNRGLGFLISKATNAFDTPLAFAGIIILLAFVLVLNAIIGFIERRSLAWMSERGGGAARVTDLT